MKFHLSLSLSFSQQKPANSELPNYSLPIEPIALSPPSPLSVATLPHPHTSEPLDFLLGLRWDVAVIMFAETRSVCTWRIFHDITQLSKLQNELQ